MKDKDEKVKSSLGERVENENRILGNLILGFKGVTFKSLVLLDINEDYN